MRCGEFKVGQTSRGARDVSHDDRDQAGASAQCPCFLFGAKGASAGVEYRGIKQRFPYQCNETEDQQDGKAEVTMEPKTASPPEPFVGEDHFGQDSLY